LAREPRHLFGHLAPCNASLSPLRVEAAWMAAVFALAPETADLDPRAALAA
jgi:hypothetical protein